MTQRPEEKIKLRTKILAYWSCICPFCNIGRRFPNSFLGRLVRRHWEKGCPSNRAYRKLFGKKESQP